MNLWEQVLRKVEPKLNGQVFDTWLKPTQQVSMSEGTLEVEVPSSFFVEWISQHYLPLLRDSLSEIHQGDLAIRFKARPGAVEDAPLGLPSERFLRRRSNPPPPPGSGFAESALHVRILRGQLFQSVCPRGGQGGR